MLRTYLRLTLGMLALTLVTPARGGEVLVTGTKLQVVDDAARPERRRITLVVHDAGVSTSLPPAGGTDDPRCPSPGATFEILATTHPEASGRIVLPCEHWTAVGSPVNAYRYRNRTGPVRSATIRQRRGVLRVGVKGTLGDLSLDEPSQAALTAVFTVGESTRFCATFGGRVRKDEVGGFVATGAPAPSACPPVVTPTASPTTGGVTPIPTMLLPATVTPTLVPTATATPIPPTPTNTATPAMMSTPTVSATPGGLLVAPSFIEFGDVDRDLDVSLCSGYCAAAHATRLVRIRNVGATPVTIDAIPQRYGDVFRVDEQSAGGTVLPGSEHFLVVTFDPRLAPVFELCSDPRPPAPLQDHDGLLTVYTNAGTLEIPLHGRTVDALAVGSLEPTPIGWFSTFCTDDDELSRSVAVNGIVDFGNVAVGGTRVKTLRNLANVGGTASRVVSAEIIGPDATLFLAPVLQPEAGFTFPTTAPRQHQWNGGADPVDAAVHLTFAPTGIVEPRTVAAVLVVHTEDGQTVEIGLTAQAFDGPLLSLDVQRAYEFQRISAGASARTTSLGSAAAGLIPATLVLTNDGNRPTGTMTIRFSAIPGSVAGTPFGHDFTTGPLPPFSETTVTLAFAPGNPGHYGAVLDVLEDGVVRASAIVHGVGKGTGVAALGTSEPWHIVDDRSFDEAHVVAVLPTGLTATLTALTGIPDPCLVADPDNVVALDQHETENDDLSVVGGTVYAIDSDLFDGRDTDQYNSACSRRLASSDSFGAGGLLRGNAFVDGPRGVADLFSDVSGALELDVASDGTAFFTQEPSGRTQLLYRKSGNAKVLVDDLSGLLVGDPAIEVENLRAIRTGSGHRVFIALANESHWVVDVVETSTLAVSSVQPLGAPLSQDAGLDAAGRAYTAVAQGSELVVTATDLVTGVVAATYRSGSLPFVPNVSGVRVDRLGNVFVDVGAFYWFAPGGTPRGLVLASPVFYPDDLRGSTGEPVFCAGESVKTPVMCFNEVWFGK